MEAKKVEFLEKEMKETWEVPEKRKTTLPTMSNIKKEYTYGRYRNIILYSLNEPTEEGFHFIVYYDPTGACYGFEQWKDAESFAKGRNAHASAFNQLWGD